MPKLLFVPVSGTFGMGEYARSLAIAEAAKARWRDADIHFVLSERAPYATTVPFPATLLPGSPTFHTAEVVTLLQSSSPDIVIFDSAGRTAQLRAARRVNAAVIYISARARQRAKAFRWRWMRLIDEHWIAYPEFIAGTLTWLERLKLKLLQRPVVRFLDVILANGIGAEADDRRDAVLLRHDCTAGKYVLIVPGGGTGHPGARNAATEFFNAATLLAQKGVAVMYVGPEPASSPTNTAALKPAFEPALELAARLRAVTSLPQSDLFVLMHSARLIVANGGSTLLQGIASGVACVGVPIAKDQGKRLERCVAAGVAVAAPLDGAAMARVAGSLLDDTAATSAMATCVNKLELSDGIEVAINAMSRLLAIRQRVD